MSDAGTTVIFLSKELEIHIKGLYLTGQDCLSCGVAGALSGGWMAAESILEYDDLISLFTRSLRKDLINNT